MFGEQPPGYTPTAADVDMRKRCVPSPEQLSAGLATLRALTPTARETDKRAPYCVVVPIAFPRKQHGFWVEGQAVVHPPGMWVAWVNGGEGPRGLGYVRNEAELAACRYLGEGEGTPGVTYIYADGNAATFEGFRRVTQVES